MNVPDEMVLFQIFIENIIEIKEMSHFRLI